jgi:hypothetical protein
MKRQPNHERIAPGSLEGVVASVLAFQSLLDEVPEEGKDDAARGIVDSLTCLGTRDI